MKIGAERIRKIVLSLRNFSRLDEAELKTYIALPSQMLYNITSLGLEA